MCRKSFQLSNETKNIDIHQHFPELDPDEHEILVMMYIHQKNDVQTSENFACL